MVFLVLSVCMTMSDVSKRQICILHTLTDNNSDVVCIVVVIVIVIVIVVAAPLSPWWSSPLTVAVLHAHPPITLLILVARAAAGEHSQLGCGTRAASACRQLVCGLS